MDKIYIEDLEIFANHGVFNEENVLGQKFLISLELDIDLREAGKTDDLAKTINYGELCWAVEEEFKKENYNLLEKCSEKVCEYILVKYEQVKGVKIKLKKPWAPIGKPLKYAAVEMERKKHTAYIGVGSNMGDKTENIDLALDKINKSNHTKVKKVSSIIETEPFGYTEQDKFLNCALEIETLLMPDELVTYLLEVEKELKRERIIKWGPRTIDLDVLLYDDIVTNTEIAVIPHPGISKRMFVLEPLSEIAPYVVHPLLNKRIVEIKEELEKELG